MKSKKKVNYFCKNKVTIFVTRPGPWAGAHGPGPDPGPGQGPWTRAGPGTNGQGHGPGPGPMDQAIISEAANAADFKGGCGGAEPPHMKKV